MRDVLQAKAPDQYITQVEGKYAAINDFKQEVLADLEPIANQVEAIKRKLMEKSISENEESGIITGELSAYLDCLTIDKDQLEELLGLE